LVISPEDRHYNEMMELDLHEFDMVTASVVRKKFNMLLKVRKVMRDNMTVSGEHDNDSYNFVDAAMKKTNCSGLTKIGCYYFFERCAAHPEVDVTFSDSMDMVLMLGGTNSPLDESSLGMHSTSANTAGGSTDKKSAYAAIVDMSHVARSIAKEMKETNTLAKESNRIANQRQLIILAQHLGKEDILEDLLTSLTSNATSSNSGGGVLDG
jgi:hypothetical protein